MSFKLKFPLNSDVIFTTYFNTKNNPQVEATYKKAPKDSLSYIFSWYSSVVFHNLNGVIIHDGLTDDFIRTYERDNIQFILYNPKKYSLNDERFIALDLILKENILGKVLLTDGSDVTIKKDPFQFMDNPKILYFGSDEPMLPTIRDNLWCVQKLLSLNESRFVEINDNFLDFNYINAGVYGGSYENIKSFNETLTILFNLIDNDKNNNMLAINYLLWKYSIEHFKGVPFTSPFKKYESHGDYFIIHK